LREVESTSNTLATNATQSQQELIETRKKLQLYESNSITHDDKFASLEQQLARMEDINNQAKNTVVITEARLQEALQQLESIQTNKKHRVGSTESGANAWWLQIANDSKQKAERDASLNLPKRSRSLLDDVSATDNDGNSNKDDLEEFNSKIESEERKRQQNEALLNQGKVSERSERKNKAAQVRLASKSTSRVAFVVKLTISHNFTRFAHRILSWHCGHLGAGDHAPQTAAPQGADFVASYEGGGQRAIPCRAVPRVRLGAIHSHSPR